jgi:hypothetical protein
MASLSRWLEWRPSLAVSENGPSATKPTEPSKPVSDFWITGASPSGAGEGHWPEPAGLRTVESWFGGRKTRMTIARHNLNGRNRFGQDAAKYPYCLVNLAAWKECRFDLRVANWFHSREEATSAARGCIDPPVDTPPVSRVWSASFPDGIQAELRSDHGNRWLTWVSRDGRTERRRDLVSPCAEHAKRTAECYLGTPVSGWSACRLSEPGATA